MTKRTYTKESFQERLEQAPGFFDQYSLRKYNNVYPDDSAVFKMFLELFSTASVNNFTSNAYLLLHRSSLDLLAFSSRYKTNLGRIKHSEGNWIVFNGIALKRGFMLASYEKLTILEAFTLLSVVYPNRVKFDPVIWGDEMYFFGESLRVKSLLGLDSRKVETMGEYDCRTLISVLSIR